METNRLSGRMIAVIPLPWTAPESNPMAQSPSYLCTPRRHHGQRLLALGPSIHLPMASVLCKLNHPIQSPRVCGSCNLASHFLSQNCYFCHSKGHIESFNKHVSILIFTVFIVLVSFSKDSCVLFREKSCCSTFSAYGEKS
mmetsp:Transcript_20952/g.31764  ORF Transcript_20952/g.31764 Transcript_20952/m.31764 type:complete len:141 (+) Transcript_20952:3048-3470(+)